MLRQEAAQPEFVAFKHPFGETLRADNRWVVMSRLVPWDLAEKLYAGSMDKAKGRPGLPARVAVGALLLQQALKVTDRDLVEHVRENLYLQYFLGFSEYVADAPFDASMLVHFRKRFGEKEFSALNDEMMRRAQAASKALKNTPASEDDDDPGGGGGASSAKPPTHHGKLVIDATCVPADIRHPTDLGLLDEARRASESLIDGLWQQHRDGHPEKPRTYRRVAAKRYARVVRQKKPRLQTLRRECRYQLNCLERNLIIISTLCEQSRLTELPERQRHRLTTLIDIYHQQCEIQRDGETSVPSRILTLGQPHVRPIYRGKARSDFEFGAKISLGIGDGYTFLDRLSWEPYNECHDLVRQVLAYHERFDRFPESIHADKIYHTRENHQFCADMGIRLSAPPLGRPAPDHAEKIAQLRQDERDRNIVEGRIGIAKRRLGLSRIRSKLQATSGSTIACIIFVMNLLALAAARLLHALITHTSWDRHLLHTARRRLSQSVPTRHHTPTAHPSIAPTSHPIAA